MQYNLGKFTDHYEISSLYKINYTVTVQMLVGLTRSVDRTNSRHRIPLQNINIIN